MSDLAAQTEESIHLRALLPEGRPVLVAASGGLDSMVLLHVFQRLSSTNRWTLAVGHFNHKLRGQSSERDEILVRHFCEKWGIPFYRSEGNVRAHARRKQLSIEMAARELRHAFLARIALEHDITTVATAHHADDQAELFVLRMLRGGGAGLAGMKWKGPSPGDSGVQIIRPFLNQTKAALKKYARRQRVVFREDASNRENRIPRNRVRNQILPFLRRVQPSFMSAALRSMEIIGAETEFTQLAANRWLAKGRRSRFEALHPAVQRQVIQMQLTGLGIPPGFDLIESLRLMPDQVVTVAPGRGIFCDGQGRVRLQSGVADGFNESRREVSLKGQEGEVEFDGLRLHWCVKHQSAGGPRGSNGMRGREWFDARKVGRTVILRHWQPGDRFQPIGMSSPIKLQDFLTNRKISRERRRSLVIATTGGGEIFWIEGARIGELFKLDTATTRRLGWCWLRQAT